MVTDTIKKVANAILDAGEGCQSGLVYVDPVEAAKAAIAVLSAEECSYNAGFNDGWEAANGEPPEAALSMDAEPVAWIEKDDLRYLHAAKVSALDPSFKQSLWVGGKSEDRSPLYDRPQPAPSVAVKANREEIARIIDPHNFMLTGADYGTDEEGFKNTWAYMAQRVALTKADCVIAALSAQVQDVAVWQPIETAPDECGFVCMVKETKSPFREVKAKRTQYGGWANMQSGILLPLRPTHWMPLPAAPAPKLEEKP